MRLITDIENQFDKKKIKLDEINLDLNKDIFILTNKNTNCKIDEEEEQEETKANSCKEQKGKKEKILNIEIITSSYIKKGTLIKLTSEGYAQGIRKIKDGITYFGYEEINENNSNDVSLLKYIIFCNLAKS